MTDVLGPRLTRSPGFRRAEQWARTTMLGFGLTNAMIEPWGEHGVGWTKVYTSLHLLEPTYQPVIGYPLAFTPGTVGPRFTADAERFSDEQLRALAHATIGAPLGIDGTEYRWDPVIKTYLPVGGGASIAGPSAEELLKFFKSENVGVVLQAAPGQDGTVFVDGRPGSRQDRSWHAGTGATDDAAGVAVALEAMRILKAIGVEAGSRLWETRCVLQRRQRRRPDPGDLPPRERAGPDHFRVVAGPVCRPRGDDHHRQQRIRSRRDCLRSGGVAGFPVHSGSTRL